VIFRKFSIGLLLLDLLLLIAGYLLVTFTDVTLHFSEIIILTLCFSTIILLSLFIFSKGLKKEPAGGTMYLLVAIALKMLLGADLAVRHTKLPVGRDKASTEELCGVLARAYESVNAII